MIRVTDHAPEYPQTVARMVIVDRNQLAGLALAKLLANAFPKASLTTVTDLSVAPDGSDLVLAKIDSVQGDIAALASRAASGGRFVVVLEEPEAGVVIEALAAGAAGILTTDSSGEEFVESIRSVAWGDLPISRAAFSQLLQAAMRVGSVEPRESQMPLSPAELSILTLLAGAKSVRAIAAHHGVTPKTVRNHLAHVYRKLNVHSRTEAILYAMRSGLVSPNS